MRALISLDKTVESLFYLWKTTGEERWRERGWEIFLAIEERCKTEFGYANVASVDDEPFRNDNDMPRYAICFPMEWCSDHGTVAGFWPRRSSIFISYLTIQLQYCLINGFSIPRRIHYPCLIGQVGKSSCMTSHIRLSFLFFFFGKGIWMFRLHCTWL